jgi:hypothetical protein
MEYVDILTAMRARWEVMEKDKGKKKVLSDIWKSMTMKSSSTMNAYVQVATQQPSVWARILECLQLVDPKKGKPVFSSNYQLHQLGVLKHLEDREAILDLFLKRFKENNPLSIPRWHNEIKNLSARRAIEDYIEGVVNAEAETLKGTKPVFDDIKDVINRLDNEFVETWVPRVKALKNHIPDDLRRSVAEIIRASNKAEMYMVTTPFSLYTSLAIDYWQRRQVQGGATCRWVGSDAYQRRLPPIRASYRPFFFRYGTEID